MGGVGGGEERKKDIQEARAVGGSICWEAQEELAAGDPFSSANECACKDLKPYSSSECSQSPRARR